MRICDLVAHLVFSFTLSLREKIFDYHIRNLKQQSYVRFALNYGLQSEFAAARNCTESCGIARNCAELSRIARVLRLAIAPKCNPLRDFRQT